MSIRETEQSFIKMFNECKERHKELIEIIRCIEVENKKTESPFPKYKLDNLINLYISRTPSTSVNELQSFKEKASKAGVIIIPIPIKKHLKRKKITMGALRAINLLKSNPEKYFSASEISEHIGITYISPLLKKLSEGGYVDVIIDPSDFRAKKYIYRKREKNE